MNKPFTNKRIGVLMGGTSSERDISMRSGLAIYQNLMELGYECVVVDVGKDIANVLKKDKVKIAFMALHGGTGENGAVQGLLEVIGIPYTGSGVLASALAMDKEVSKKIFSYHELPVAPSITVVKKKNRKIKGPDKQAPDATGAYLFPGFSGPSFGLPWIVKPASEGSSIGVEIVKEESGLEPCLEKAFSFDNRVIIEQFIKGREIHIAVLGDRALGGVEVRPSLEFYNYEAKYTSGLTEYIIPPEVDEEVYKKAKEMALKAHLVLGCAGASRVDFMLDESNSLYLLEVNTLPGMTSTSLLPKIAESSGMSVKDLIEEMIKLAL